MDSEDNNVISGDRIHQLEELDCLSSIYLVNEFYSSVKEDGHITGIFFAEVKLPDNFRVTYRETENSLPFEIELKHLPLIELNFTLPLNYPSLCPPDVEINCVWLTPMAINVIRSKLHELWVNGQYTEILFTWCEYLKNDVVVDLGIGDLLDLSSVIDDGLNQQQYEGEENKIGNKKIQVFLDHNQYMEKIVFNKSMINCLICLEDKLGVVCTKFSGCEHAYCKHCVNRYLTEKITNGSVLSIECAEPKCTAEATQAFIREFVPDNLFERYDKLLLSLTLDMLDDVVYCPRKDCQYPCTRTDAEEKLVVCPLCIYAFCCICKKGYHGVALCDLEKNRIQQIIQEYTNGTDEVKKVMEKRYGKSQLRSFINSSLCDNWLNDNSKSCPHCRTFIEKSEGCNLMTCQRCQKHFCWLCGKGLSCNNPYRHFDDPNSPCNQLLFHLVDMANIFPEDFPEDGEFEIDDTDDFDFDPTYWVDLTDVDFVKYVDDIESSQGVDVVNEDQVAVEQGAVGEDAIDTDALLNDLIKQIFVDDDDKLPQDC